MSAKKPAISVMVPPKSPSKSPKSKQSVRFQVPTPSQPIRSPIKRPPPTVKFEIPHTRDYLKMLHQTKIVYDQLLAAKQVRLIADLYSTKDALDVKCSSIQAKDQKQGIEFSVKAQEELNRLQIQADMELSELHKDYQSKLNKMRDSLEEKWLLDHGHDGVSGDVPYTVYTKK